MPRALEIDAVTKRFGETLALDGLGLRLEPGEMLGLLGRNGGEEIHHHQIAGLLVLGAAMAPVVFTYAITRRFGEWGLAVGLWCLAGAGALGCWRALPFFGQRVRDMKEQFLEAT